MELLPDARGKAGCDFVSIHELMKIEIGMDTCKDC